MVIDNWIQRADSVELWKRRERKGYRARAFDDNFFGRYGNDAQKFLQEGRNMFCSPELIDGSSVALFKVSHHERSVVIYVDRDYFEVVFVHGRERRHLLQWQFSSLLKGYNMDDLEYSMGTLLFRYEDEPIRRQPLRRRTPREYWEEGQDPMAVLLMEEAYEDS